MGGQGPQGQAVPGFGLSPTALTTFGGSSASSRLKSQLPTSTSTIVALSYLRRSPCRSRRSSRCPGFHCCALGSIHTSAVRVRGCNAFAPPPCRKLRSLLLHLGRELGGAASRQRTELPWATHLMPQACWLFSSFFCGPRRHPDMFNP